MARYLGSGDGEGSSLSRRGESARAAGSSLPRRLGALLGPRPGASGPGRPSSAPRRYPRGPGRLELPGRPAAGRLSCGAPGSPHPLPSPGRPRSRAEGGKGLLRRAGGHECRLRHPSRSVTAAATATTAEVLLPTCREDTGHARAETTSGKIKCHLLEARRRCVEEDNSPLRYQLCEGERRLVGSQTQLFLAPPPSRRSQQGPLLPGSRDARASGIVLSFSPSSCPCLSAFAPSPLRALAGFTSLAFLRPHQLQPLNCPSTSRTSGAPSHR
ncbi:uncharacterized protein [Saccopteryx bilineata]|uniref:uncharacterized protein n=1 Tax=Saccopteryx bilineata TaxID=59482 RepID=UPI0033904D3C